MTATVIEQEIDASFFELVDFESEEQCEGIIGGCPNEPKWLAIHLCCGEDTLSCDNCKTKVQDWGDAAECNYCDTYPLTIRWEPKP